MTEQELQDKAKDLAKNVPLRKDIPYPEMIRNFLASMYLRGYDDGKNDTTKWHYPSKGEYPTEGETVFVAFQEGGLWYFANAEYHEGGWASVVDLGNIVAWQYFVPPKEEV